MHVRIAHLFRTVSEVDPGKTPVVAVLADTLIEIAAINLSDSEPGCVSHWGTQILKVALLASCLERWKGKVTQLDTLKMWDEMTVHSCTASNEK